MEKSINKKLTYLILSFILYAFIGWIYEVILEFYYGNGFVNRGFLFGPYLPVYGFGALLILLLLYKFSMSHFLHIHDLIKDMRYISNHHLLY